MDSIDKSKEINSKNCTFYYFNDIAKIKDFNFDNILLDEKSHENILVDNISYKTLICAKPLRIWFDNVDGFIRIYDGTRYLVLFGVEKCDFIYNRTSYFLGVKSGITYDFSHNYAKIKIDSYKSLPLQKTFTFHNVIIHIKLIWNKGFKFQPDVWNGCNYVLMMSMNLGNIAILDINCVDYRYVISRISKSETINLMQNI